MQIFGHYFFEEDPEEKAYLEQKEEKRRERVKHQCELWEMQDKHLLWDIIEMPVGVFMKDPPEKDDVKLHETLMKRQECHIFYGKKYCYHTERGEVITDLQ